MRAIMNFISFRVMENNYNIEILNSKTTEEDQQNASMQVNISHSNVENNNGILELALIISDFGIDYRRDISIKVQGVFSFDDVDDDDYCENLLRVNGSAILMPYIRNYISMITGFDNSTEHLLLPTMNIQAIIDSETPIDE
ncbi:protein-export chaperone SecB [Mammaliicoccus lentus]|uniref:protein-export chaperone SecB n=1 Tax=Mammaliicoccus lentus TaxID=42858 RepID=UPI001071EA22|nr:protein-export chaperone SecB [Mammaliicoccus lentus]MBF0749781.1 protein-export chaperone SecB [Mammaliicoccus lentus]TFU57232.1 hypothetical protein E4T93_10195 [Mammaliicoccus lentus]